MYKKGVCAKKWIKIDPDLGAKEMFFPRTQRTLPKPGKNNPAMPRNGSHCQA